MAEIGLERADRAVLPRAVAGEGPAERGDLQGVAEGVAVPWAST